MGQFIYGNPSVAVDFDDRVLAHLKVVVLAKVRRGESFTFSWEFAAAAGSGHSTIWIHPTIPLQFNFLGNREPRLHLANPPAGLRPTPEPAEGTSGSRP
jgi:hypothetical protein